MVVYHAYSHVKMYDRSQNNVAPLAHAASRGCGMLLNTTTRTRPLSQEQDKPSTHRQFIERLGCVPPGRHRAARGLRPRQIGVSWRRRERGDALARALDVCHEDREVSARAGAAHVLEQRGRRRRRGRSSHVVSGRGSRPKYESAAALARGRWEEETGASGRRRWQVI
jgi:hypothetical protein